MKTKFLAFAVLTALLFVSCDSASFDDSVDMEESVNFNKTASVNNSYVIISTTNKLPNGIKKSISDASGSITSEIAELGMVVVSSNDPNFMSKASKIKGVQSVFPNHEIQWLDPDMTIEMVDASSINPPNTGDDDYFFDLQWGHDAVDAPEAWETGQRGKGVMVFVLDSGIDAENPDLAPNLNTSLCKSFVPGEEWNIQPGDYFNHGTHVAGTIAGADNGYGIIGIAPEATLVAVKVLSEYNGSGNFSWLVEAIVYAANNGADVINMSLSGMDLKRFGKDVAHLKNAVNRATTYAHQNGVTVVAAAGNDGWDRNHLKFDNNPYMDLVVLPADGPNVIQVSATAPLGWALSDPENTFLDYPAVYSNHGSMIDFAGPGGTVEYPGNEWATIAGLYRPVWLFDLVFSSGSGDDFYWAQGTSMASPHVAGVAALIIGKNGGSMKPAQVISALKRSSDDLGKRGNDDHYGAGRVNAYRAVTQ